MTFYCTACWKEIREDDRKCPHCGADVSEHDRKSFDEKLILALRHPVRETAGIAVWILGEREVAAAVTPLIGLFERTDNPYLQREILGALGKIGTRDAIDFITKSLGHPVGMVRRQAEEIMDQKRSQKKNE